jgi:hypothetical protein
VTTTVYRVVARIGRGAVCIIRGAEMHPMRASDPAHVGDGLPLIAAEGMHPGDRCFILGERVRRVREGC